MKKMVNFDHTRFFLAINESDIELTNILEVRLQINEALCSSKGSVSLAADDGQRPWWQRFIFGTKIYVRSYFLFEWFEETCGLIFQDEDASEYRVLSNEQPKDTSEDIRKQISFGEYKLLETKYCITKETALKAIDDFLESGKRPDWLEYKFVK